MIPPVPVGLAHHRPCLWVPPPRIATPQREREENEDAEDEEMEDPDPKRRPSAVEYEGQYGTAARPQLGLRYSLDQIAKQPPRGYPSATALYGMEPGATLLEHPVSSANFASGRDMSRPFTRGGNDPAAKVSEAIGATRVSAETIEMCTGNAIRQTLEIIHPFTTEADIFHVYRNGDLQTAQQNMCGPTAHA